MAKARAAKGTAKGQGAVNAQGGGSQVGKNSGKKGDGKKIDGRRCRCLPWWTKNTKAGKDLENIARRPRRQLSSRAIVTFPVRLVPPS